MEEVPPMDTFEMPTDNFAFNDDEATYASNAFNENTNTVDL